jgi:hypothetical protein
MMTPESVRAVADNIWTVVIARLAMVATPFVAAALVWFGSQWLAEKFAAISNPILAIERRVDTLEGNDRVQQQQILTHEYRLNTDKENAGKVASEVSGLATKIGELSSKFQSLTDVLSDRERRMGNNSP